MIPGEGDLFPDFSLEGFDTREALAMGPMVVFVWRIGCSTSRLAAPFFDRLAAAYPGATVVSVCQETRQEIDSYAAEHGLTFRQLADEDLRVTRLLDVTVVPSYWLVDRSGMVLISGNGWDRGLLERIGERLALLLGVAGASLVRDSDDVPAFKPG